MYGGEQLGNIFEYSIIKYCNKRITKFSGNTTFYGKELTPKLKLQMPLGLDQNQTGSVVAPVTVLTKS